MIKIGSCTDCRSVESKSVVCENYYHTFGNAKLEPYRADYNEATQPWGYGERSEPSLSVVRKTKVNQYPDMVDRYEYWTYNKDPVTGVITSSDEKYGFTWNGYDRDQFNHIVSNGYYDGNLSIAIAAVDSVDFDKMAWNTHTKFRVNYGTLSTVYANRGGSAVRIEKSAKYYNLVIKHQLRIDGKYCLTKLDRTADIRAPFWNGAPTPGGGYTHVAVEQLGDCHNKKIVNLRTPSFWGESEIYLENCAMCPDASGTVSPAMCYPVP